MPVAIDVPVVRWDGCYDDGWRELIVPGAFAHPAKMARGLVARIFDELFEMGALSKGSVVVDPFGGIGTTAIEGASRGVQVFCCELEPKFVDLQRENFELHRRDWQAMGRPMPVVVQGDSRQLRQALADVLWLFSHSHDRGNNAATDTAADCVVASPPYAKADGHPALGDFKHTDGGDILAHVTNAGRGDDKYGRMPGQLAELPEGRVEAIVSSPPYAEIASGAGGLNTKPAKDGQQGGRSASSASQDTDQRYGESAGQLARLPAGEVDAIVCSPPYSTGDSASAQSITTRTDKSAEWVKKNCGSAATEGYGLTAGQLGVMPSGDVADALVSSPPYEGSLHASNDGIDWEKAVRETGQGGEHQAPGASATAAYPTSDENIGNASGETFWSAARDIVAESYAILKPGGIAVWVVKHFVRKGQLVDFPGDWRKLCEHVGFETIQEVHASLVAEEVRSDLFDGERTVRRERKSFFRRLAEKKGSPRIDFETVFFMRKPA